MQRCQWVTEDQIYIDYHDYEWGVPVFDDHRLFEFLILEGAQAGLSWLTVLKKREQYRKRFFNFNPEKIARLNQKSVESLMKDPGIIRNRLKIESTISNAKAYLKMLEKGECFSDYLWQFVDDQPIQHDWKRHRDIPTHTALSDRLSKDLKKRGFKFVGTTICYSLMQAVGMVNDHITTCFCHQKVKQHTKRK